MGQTLGRQSAMRGILGTFTLVFYSFIAMIPLVLLMPRRKAPEHRQ